MKNTLLLVLCTAAFSAATFADDDAPVSPSRLAAKIKEIQAKEPKEPTVVVQQTETKETVVVKEDQPVRESEPVTVVEAEEKPTSRKSRRGVAAKAEVGVPVAPGINFVVSGAGNPTLISASPQDTFDGLMANKVGNVYVAAYGTSLGHPKPPEEEAPRRVYQMSPAPRPQNPRAGQYQSPPPRIYRPLGPPRRICAPQQQCQHQPRCHH